MYTSVRVLAHEKKRLLIFVVRMSGGRRDESVCVRLEEGWLACLALSLDKSVEKVRDTCSGRVFIGMRSPR